MCSCLALQLMQNAYFPSSPAKGLSVTVSAVIFESAKKKIRFTVEAAARVDATERCCADGTFLVDNACSLVLSTLPSRKAVSGTRFASCAMERTMRRACLPHHEEGVTGHMSPF